MEHTFEALALIELGAFSIFFIFVNFRYQSGTAHANANN